METLKAFKKIGKPIFITLLGLSLWASPSFAENRITAELDRTQISAEESVSLKITVQAEGNVQINNVRFHAPDFDVINEYQSSHFQSYYENGKFGTRTSQSLTKVLRPSKTGQLRITGISVEAGGEKKTAPDLTVQVTPAGGGTPPTKNYGNSGVGLRGAGKAGNIAKPVFLRAEVDHAKVYKGQQVVVSYYLYSRVRMFDISATKFPELKGFLKEDLDVPLSGARLDSQRVVHDGVPYDRSLLVRYAAYPLQEGKLTLDPLHLKYTYTPSRGLPGFDSDDDPFVQFFSSLAPREGRERNDPVTLEVISLPEEGRPQSFSGGVGDFNVTAAVDKYAVRANEAVSLTVKIEGKGNVAAISEPKAKWPEQIELYDTKGRAKSSKGGVGEKVFDFLLIPRVPGKLELPALEFSFFDPNQKKYVTKTTEPFSIQVSDPAPGSALIPMKSLSAAPSGVGSTASTSGIPADPLKAELRYLLPPKPEGASLNGILGHPLWRWLYWAAAASLLFFLGLLMKDFALRLQTQSHLDRVERSKAEAKSWDKLREKATSSNNWQDVLSCYEKLSELLLDSLEAKFPIGVRSLSRKDLEQILVHEKSFNAALWEKINLVLEHSETVRFASGAGAISEASARSTLTKWVDEARTLARILEKDYKSS